MKKWLGALALAAASVGLAQEPYSLSKADYSVAKNGGLILPAGYLTIKDESTPLTQRSTLTFLGSAVTCADNAGETQCTITSSGYATVQDETTPLTQRATINFTGSGVACVDNAGATRTDCTISSGGAPTGATYITQTSDGTLSAEQALSGLSSGVLVNTTGTGVLSIYAGTSCTNQFVRSLNGSASATCASVANADIATATIDLTTKVTGLLPAANFADGSARSVFGRSANSSGVQASIAGAGAGTHLTDNGTSLGFKKYPVDPATETVVFDDMYSLPPNGGGATEVPLGLCFGVGSGTSSGFLRASIPNADGNHPGVNAITTGTTTTGTYSIVCGRAAPGGSDSVVIAGGEVFEWMVYVPNVSTGTDTFKTWIGAGDVTGSNGEPQDGLNVYWDNNTDTHWGCQAAQNSTRTNTISTTVATGAAWHKVRITVNSNATSVAYNVDGSDLSCSPLTTNIPTGNTKGLSPQFKIGASAGCSVSSTCTAAIDYLYFYKPLSR